MNYSNLSFPKQGVEVQLASFCIRGKVAEYHAMLHVNRGNDTYESQLSNLHEAYVSLLVSEELKESVPVFKRYFLSDAANQTEKLNEKLKMFPPCAVSVVQQPPLDGSKIALWVYFQSNIKTEDGELFSASHNGYHHYWTGGLHHASGDSEVQTEVLLNHYEELLQAKGCTLKDHCVRTWFFVQNVDVNYAGVVKARKENFAIHGLTEQTHYITSTGIEGRFADSKVSVLLDAYAVTGLQEGQQKYLYALGYLNPTYEYGVTFERGVSLEFGDRKQVYLSGTASIDNKGEVMHVGDIIAQVHRTVENVKGLLKEGECTLDHLAQIIVYLRDMADYDRVKKLYDKEFPEVPTVIVLAPVCRPAWLIEMECIAIKATNNSDYKDL